VYDLLDYFQVVFFKGSYFHHNRFQREAGSVAETLSHGTVQVTLRYQVFQTGAQNALGSPVVNTRIMHLSGEMSPVQLRNYIQEQLGCDVQRARDPLLMCDGRLLHYDSGSVVIHKGSVLEVLPLPLRGGMQRKQDTTVSPKIRDIRANLMICHDKIKGLTEKCNHLVRDSLAHPPCVDASAAQFTARSDASLGTKGKLSDFLVSQVATDEQFPHVSGSRKVSKSSVPRQQEEAYEPAQQLSHQATANSQQDKWNLSEQKATLCELQKRFFDECEELVNAHREKVKTISELEIVITNMHREMLSKAQNLATGDTPFDAKVEDEELIRDLFRELVSDQDCLMPAAELKLGLMKYEEYKEMTEMLHTLLSQQPGSIGLDSFSEAIHKLPRAKGQRVQWAATLGLNAELARFLKKGNIFDGLQGLRELCDEEIDVHVQQVCESFLLRLPAILKKGLYNLKAEERASALHLNSKFSMDGAEIGKFAGLKEFYEGPERILGSPNPNVGEGMRREHCERQNSNVMFQTLNYNLKTCPADEWKFVLEPPQLPKDQSEWPPGCRWRGRTVYHLDFLEKMQPLSANLKVQEIIAARLYTGPMYMLYNAALRKAPQDRYEILEGNSYETTIFCIISCITKLAKTSDIPRDRLLYRGLVDMTLPMDFWTKNKDGYRGAVEPGLMSTTAEMSVALKYSKKGRNRGTVFEIAAGRIDLGADLKWLSQYPGESEYLFPPLTCMEVVGEPRIHEGVIIFPLRANVNLKCLTLEQLQERRKHLYEAMLKNLQEEIGIDMSSLGAILDKQLKVRI
jgi:hypothetical protein